jgi:glycosyltransferase involved in cell wall biosynthesis
VRIAQLEARLVAVQQRLEDIAAASAHHAEQLRIATEVLRTLHDEEATNRLRLHELRRTAEYERAFDEADPLVSVVISTYDRPQLLCERSISSVLEQTYQNFEIVIVGDGAPAEVCEALASLDEPRIRYFNMSVRGPYSDLPEHAWLAVGTPPFNRAIAEARGRWLAPLDDDDTFTPEHIERLLETARARRLELVYGLLRCNYPDGTQDFIGEFPPRTEFTELRSSFGLQAALLHSGLRFMQMHLTDPLFGLANDVSLARRMIRAGVQLGMIDEVVSDYYPARVWESDHPAPIKKTAARR